MTDREIENGRKMAGIESGEAENTDKEIWRETPGDVYSDSIHVTNDGKIGINCGGHVVVMPLRMWHRLALKEGLKEV